MIEQIPAASPAVLAFKMSGKLHDEDYKKFVPLVDEAITKSGKVRILAVTSRERVSFARDVPTIYEAGFPALAVETTAGLYGPSSMPRELRERLSKDVIAVVSDPVITERLVATGQAINTGGPEELAKTLKQQAEQMAVVAKELGLKAGK